MDQSKIPVRYAKALFLYGKEQGILSKLAEDVDLFADFFEQNPSVIPWLINPVIKIQQKKDAFTKHFKDNVSEISLRFLELVISKKREKFFPAIFRNFIHLYKADAGIKTLVLTSVTEVDDVIKQKISHRYQKHHKKGHEIVTRIKPSIIGGFMLQIDDLLYDASLSTELKRLRKELTGQVIEKNIKKTRP